MNIHLPAILMWTKKGYKVLTHCHMGKWFTIEFCGPRPRFIPISYKPKWFQFRYQWIVLRSAFYCYSICLVATDDLVQKETILGSDLATIFATGDLPGNSRRLPVWRQVSWASLDHLVEAQLGKNNNLELLKQVGPPVLHQVSPSFT